MELLAGAGAWPLPESSFLSRCTCPGWLRQPQVNIRDVAFRSQGVTLRGYLMLPVEPAADGRRPPVVVMSHGFSATQHMGLMDTARTFCQRTGCAALTFDHGGFGESDGAPHHFCMWGCFR